MAKHSFIFAMNKKKAHKELELKFSELRTYPNNFGAEAALKEMGAWIDNPDPDVRAFVAQKLSGADQSCGYYDEMFRIMLSDEDSLVRCRAAKGCQADEIDDSAIPLLLELVRNKESAADRYFGLATLLRMQRWYEAESGWDITDWALRGKLNGSDELGSKWIEVEGEELPQEYRTRGGLTISDWIEIRSLLYDDDPNVKGMAAKLLMSNISFVRWLAGHCEKDVIDALQFYNEPSCNWPPYSVEGVWSPVHYYFGHRYLCE
jgi:hypothetical protein